MVGCHITAPSFNPAEKCFFTHLFPIWRLTGLDWDFTVYLIHAPSCTLFRITWRGLKKLFFPFTLIKNILIRIKRTMWTLNLTLYFHFYFVSSCLLLPICQKFKTPLMANSLDISHPFLVLFTVSLYNMNQWWLQRKD